MISKNIKTKKDKGAATVERSEQIVRAKRTKKQSCAALRSPRNPYKNLENRENQINDNDNDNENSLPQAAEILKILTKNHPKNKGTMKFTGSSLRSLRSKENPEENPN